MTKARSDESCNRPKTNAVSATSTNIEKSENRQGTFTRRKGHSIPRCGRIIALVTTETTAVSKMALSTIQMGDCINQTGMGTSASIIYVSWLVRQCGLLFCRRLRHDVALTIGFAGFR